MIDHTKPVDQSLDVSLLHALLSRVGLKKLTIAEEEQLSMMAPSLWLVVRREIGAVSTPEIMTSSP